MQDTEEGEGGKWEERRRDKTEVEERHGYGVREALLMSWE